MSEYAIVETGSKQYLVQPKSVIEVEKLEVSGKEVVLDKVLLACKNDKIEVGTPVLKDAQVICTYLGDDRTKKVVILKYRRRKSSRRKKGHRQTVSRLLVKEIKF